MSPIGDQLERTLLPFALGIGTWLMLTIGERRDNVTQSHSFNHVIEARVDRSRSELLARISPLPFNKNTGNDYRRKDFDIPSHSQYNENTSLPNNGRFDPLLSGDRELPLCRQPLSFAVQQHEEGQYPPRESLAPLSTFGKDGVHRSDTYKPHQISHISSTGGSGTYLPFKLQHDLLSAIQTLIEEACFYFAQKWLPHVLNNKGWDIPEQGELTSWWELLRDRSVPPQAIHFRGSEASALFRQCRQIRNSAVHRNPVSIPGIELMIKNAVELICGLKDMLREAKIRKIQNCLERRDLEALRLTIDEPLERFKFLRSGPLGRETGGLLEFTCKARDSAIASDKSSGYEKKHQNALQLDPSSTLSSGKPFGISRVVNNSSNSVVIPHTAKEFPETYLHTKHFKVAGRQKQSGRSKGDKASSEIQSTSDATSALSMKDVQNNAQKTEQTATGKTTVLNSGNTHTDTQIHSQSNEHSVGPVVRNAADVTALTKVESQNGSFAMNLMEDNIIDLTQDSDDESVVELGEAFVFSEQKQAPLGSMPSGRVMKPKARTERKERLRQRREERKRRRECLRSARNEAKNAKAQAGKKS